MNYVTGNLIKDLRENKGLTQKELAENLGVSDKAVSKWETNRGLPDISIIEDLAKALGISLAELLTGDLKTNRNISGNVKKTVFYVCPVCGNIITSLGEGAFSCCGILLPPLEAEKACDIHTINIENSDGELLITANHPMDKKHYISFISYVTDNTVKTVKLYPEQDICVRFKRKGHGILYIYCNKHGLFKQII